MRELGVALNKHQSTTQTFPADSYDAGGRPLLSWRVHLLPALNRADLYKRFKLDEPWDSPANLALLREMPGDYGTGASRAKAGGAEKTYFRGFSHRGAMFEKIPGPPGGSPPGVSRNGVPDGTSTTVVVFEAGDPVEWTKPDGLTFGPGQPMPAVGGVSLQNPFFHVLMADGQVKKADRNIDPATFRLLVDRQDANVIPPGWEIPGS